MHNGALVCLRAKLSFFLSFLFTIIIQCQLISYADTEKVMQILSHVYSYICTKLLVLAFKLGRTYLKTDALYLFFYRIDLDLNMLKIYKKQMHARNFKLNGFAE